MKGIAEIRELFGLIEAAGIRQRVELDLSLARGLNYYTGAIFEVKALDYEIGSICGGGRYDDLTGIFGLKDVSGVGISFGADRIYDVLLGLDKYPAALGSSPDVLFANMGREALGYVMPVCAKLREKGFSVVVFPDESKLGKQFDYATRNGIPFISINADSEAAAGTVNIKNLSEGKQQSFAKDDIDAMAAFLRQ
jgi:histidyl-tRNA synthetase